MIIKIGETIGILHKNDIMHGDLTTSNLLYDDKTNQIYVIDFGLSQKDCKIEDKAVDLYVLERAFTSTHPFSESLVFQFLYL